MFFFFFTFIVNLCRQFLRFPKKKVLGQNRPYINTLQTNLRNDCLSLILEFGLSSLSVCVLAPDSPRLRRGLEYLLKVSYIVPIDPNVAGFSIFNTVFCYRMETLPYVWKNITKISGICIW